MLAKVDFSLAYWRWLYQPLYERVLRFGVLHEWNLADIKTRFARLMLDDPSLHLLAKVEDNHKITAHCLVAFNDTIAFCEQMEADPKYSAEWVEQYFKYIDEVKLRIHPQLQRMTFMTTEKKYKAFQKKYGFAVHSIVMSKELT